MEVKFTVNKESDFRDFDRWPLNRGWPLNTGPLNTGLTVQIYTFGFSHISWHCHVPLQIKIGSSSNNNGNSNKDIYKEKNKSANTAHFKFCTCLKLTSLHKGHIKFPMSADILWRTLTHHKWIFLSPTELMGSIPRNKFQGINLPTFWHLKQLSWNNIAKKN